MNNFERRVSKLEKRLKEEYMDGIPEWAMKAAKWASSADRMYSNPALIEAFKKAGIDKEEKPLKYQTEGQIIAYARELSEKYKSDDDYRKRHFDFTKIRRILDKIEDNQTDDDK